MLRREAGNRGDWSPPPCSPRRGAGRRVDEDLVAGCSNDDGHETARFGMAASSTTGPAPGTLASGQKSVYHLFKFAQFGPLPTVTVGMPTEQPVIQVGAEQPDAGATGGTDDASLDDVIPPSPGGGGRLRAAVRCASMTLRIHGTCWRSSHRPLTILSHESSESGSRAPKRLAPRSRGPSTSMYLAMRQSSACLSGLDTLTDGMEADRTLKVVLGVIIVLSSVIASVGNILLFLRRRKQVG